MDTTVVHNAAENSSDNLFFYPPDNNARGEQDFYVDTNTILKCVL